jgi:hypothetical protein
MQLFQGHRLLTSVVMAAAISAASPVLADNIQDNIFISREEVKSVLVDDFLQAVSAYTANTKSSEVKSDKVKFWLDGLQKRGVSREFLRKRFAKAAAKKTSQDPFAKYRTINVETVENTNPMPFVAAKEMKSAIHAVKLSVTEDYDDFNNDNVYLYYITTSDDIVWGKVTDVYKNLDEGTEVFMNAEDRGVYGPTGQKLAFPTNHVIVDFGLIESDGDDITQLKKVSDAIVDLALVALAVYQPGAGAAALQARAEVNNLLHLIIELNSDDRLVTDSVYFTPNSMAEKLNNTTYFEFDRVYEKATWWTRFKYAMKFRLIK